MNKIRFVDLVSQRQRLATQIDAAVARVMEHGNFIMGPEVFELEQRLAEFTGARHVISCSSGTDALLLPLLAWGVGPGHAVLVPSFTFAATVEVVALLGATPVFVEALSDSYNMDPSDAARAVDAASKADLRPVGVIAADLFGRPAEYADLRELAEDRRLWLLADAAQSLGASYQGRSVGQLGTATATSFYPAKPLGCYGDGGAVFTDDDELADTVRSLRTHGQGAHRYQHTRVGLNARLDTLQAAVLLEKLEVFEDELAARQVVASRYERALDGLVQVPCMPEGVTSTWAQYTVRSEQRDTLVRHLAAASVPTAVYYPTPIHRQVAFCQADRLSRQLPVTDSLAETVLSLPIHPYLTAEQQAEVIEAVTTACA